MKEEANNLMTRVMNNFKNPDNETKELVLSLHTISTGTFKGSNEESNEILKEAREKLLSIENMQLRVAQSFEIIDENGNNSGFTNEETMSLNIAHNL